MRSMYPEFQLSFRYPVHFTAGLFEPDNPLLRDAVADRCEETPVRLACVVDSGVSRHNPWLLEAIHAYCRHHADVLELAAGPLLVPGGERAKDGTMWVKVVHELVHDAGLCRHSFLIAVGGGAVIDAAGLAAATAHRGIRLIRVPTTVLAQNDASVGVKNGVNAFGKKNWVGTFNPPHAVICDSRFLLSLSDRDWRAGTAEAVKVALLKDPAYFRWLEASAPALARRDLGVMETLIHQCAGLHLTHITRGGDPFELRSARPLDFGHWSAHKLEQLSGYRLRHGEAVAVGIALDCAYSRLAGILGEEDLSRALGLLEALGFDLYVPELSRDLDLLRGLDEFRQHLGGRLTITLLRGIGSGFEVAAMDEERVRKSIRLLETRIRRQHERNRISA